MEVFASISILKLLVTLRLTIKLYVSGDRNVPKDQDMTGYK